MLILHFLFICLLCIQPQYTRDMDLKTEEEWNDFYSNFFEFISNNILLTILIAIVLILFTYIKYTRGNHRFYK